ncbi:unnamed protein product, partial [Symbiodinium sp. CCMP2456]
GLMLVTNVAFLQVRMLVLQPPSCREELCDDSPFRIAPKVLGMFYFLLGIAVSCSASIFAEKFLKKWPEEPFYILKTNLMIGELILAVLGVINNFSKEDSADENNDSCSWDQFHDWRRQLPVVLVWLLHGWIAGLLVKRCSALVKNVSHILSTLATYGYALLTHALPFSWPVTQAGVLVLLAVLNFASTSDQRSHKENSHRPLLMFSVALMFSSSDSSSLLVSVPSAMSHLAAAAAYSVFSMNDWAAVAILTLALMAHLTLYLPLPLNDPESNPFYTSLRRVRHQFMRFLAQPVSGFGDEGS